VTDILITFFGWKNRQFRGKDSYTSSSGKRRGRNSCGRPVRSSLAATKIIIIIIIIIYSSL
jgi:hypothetical protein